MINMFTKHPRSVGESYWQHLGFALGFGINMVAAGMACIIHALFPFFFEKTASNILFRTLHQMINRSHAVEDRFVSLARAIKEKEASNK